LLFKNIKIKIYRSIILSAILYVFENFSFTLREVPKLRMFQNSVLWRIFRPKSDEVTDELGKLHKEGA